MSSENHFPAKWFWLAGFDKAKPGPGSKGNCSASSARSSCNVRQVPKMQVLRSPWDLHPGWASTGKHCKTSAFRNSTPLDSGAGLCGESLSAAGPGPHRMWVGYRVRFSDSGQFQVQVRLVTERAISWQMHFKFEPCLKAFGSLISLMSWEWTNRNAANRHLELPRDCAAWNASFFNPPFPHPENDRYVEALVH